MFLPRIPPRTFVTDTGVEARLEREPRKARNPRKEMHPPFLPKPLATPICMISCGSCISWLLRKYLLVICRGSSAFLIGRKLSVGIW